MFCKILPVILLFILSSCFVIREPFPESWGWDYLPLPLTGARNFPEADTEYGKGFRDGCGSSLDVISRGLSSDINGKRYDFKRMNKSPDYNVGWWDGYEHCTYIMDWDII